MTDAERTLEAIDEALEESRNAGYKKVSVLGWMGTIVLSCIPGLNLILWIVWAFVARRPSRRTFSVAMILLTLIFLALCAAAALLFGQEILNWARNVDPHLFDVLAEG